MEFPRLEKKIFVSMVGVVKGFSWVDSCNANYKACKTIESFQLAM